MIPERVTLLTCAYIPSQDAGCVPGSSMEIDLGDANTVGSMMLTIAVGSVCIHTFI